MSFYDANIYFYFPGTEGNGTLSSYLRVMPEGKLYDAVARVHNQATVHSGYKKVKEIVDREYYGIPRRYVQEFCKTCPTCEKSKPQSCRPPLKPIVEEEFLHRIQVDLIDMRHSPDNDYNYICHTVDHFTSFMSYLH